jgi:hypothetical protein
LFEYFLSDLSCSVPPKISDDLVSVLAALNLGPVVEEGAKVVLADLAVIGMEVVEPNTLLNAA